MTLVVISMLRQLLAHQFAPPTETKLPAVPSLRLTHLRPRRMRHRLAEAPDLIAPSLTHPLPSGPSPPIRSARYGAAGRLRPSPTILALSPQRKAVDGLQAALARRASAQAE
jgi:hypothetical protein